MKETIRKYVMGFLIGMIFEYLLRVDRVNIYAWVIIILFTIVVVVDIVVEGWLDKNKEELKNLKLK